MRPGALINVVGEEETSLLMQQLKHDKPWPKQTKTVSEAALQYITTWGGFVSSDGETVNNMTLKKLNLKKTTR